MRRSLAVLFAVVVLAAPARAEQPRCPLSLSECMQQFGAMRERPWLGVEVVTDSLSGARVVRAVVPGGPADRAGVKPGDTLQQVGGVEPQLWFASRAGWKRGWAEGDATTLTVGRAGHEHVLGMRLGHIPEETLARMIGVHVLEGHLAWLTPTDEGQAHAEH